MVELEVPAVKVPRGTPPWAAGMVAILCVCIGWYIAARPEINTALQNSQLAAVKKLEADGTTIGAVLDLVRANGEQISVISNALGQAQIQVANLTNRVQMLEKQLSSSEKDLKACEIKAARCKG